MRERRPPEARTLRRRIGRSTWRADALAHRLTHRRPARVIGEGISVWGTAQGSGDRLGGRCHRRRRGRPRDLVRGARLQRLPRRRPPAGIGIYLVAAALTLAILAWRAGTRGVVGSVQDAAVPVLAIVASSAALHTFGGVDQAFLTVVAATMIVTL